MGAKEIRETVHSCTLDMRSIDRTVESYLFDIGYLELSKKEKEALDELVKSIKELSDKAGKFKEWYQRNRRSFYWGLKTDELRDKARKQNIKNWSRMTKLELIQAIGS